MQRKRRRLRRRASSDEIYEAWALRATREAAGVPGNSEEVEDILLLKAVGEEELAGVLEWVWVEEGKERIVKGKCFGLLDQECDPNGLHVGTNTDLHEDGLEGYLPLWTFERPVYATGSTRRGKTTLIHDVARQLVLQREHVVVFCPEKELPRLCAEVSRSVFWWLKAPEDTLFALLEPPEGDEATPEDVRRWCNTICKDLGRNFYLRDVKLRVLTKALLQLYRDKGCFDGSRNWPTLEELVERLAAKKPGRSYTLNEAYALLVDRLGWLLEVLGPCVNGPRGFSRDVRLKQSMGIDCSELQDPLAYEIFVGLVVRKIVGNVRNPGNHYVFLDEAGILLNPEFEKRGGLLTDIVRRGSKLGLRLFLADQNASLTPSVIRANAGTIIAFGITDRDDLRCIASAQGLTKEQERRLGDLPERHVLVRSFAFEKPMVFRLPHVERRPLASEEELREEMRPILERIRSEIAEKDDGEEEAAEAEKVEEPSPEAGRKKSSLRREEFLLLDRIAAHPEEGIPERVAGLKLRNRHQEGRWRRGLMVRGLVELVYKIGKQEFFAVTRKGAELLEKRGITVQFPKSGWRHETVLRLCENAWKA